MLSGGESVEAVRGVVRAILSYSNANAKSGTSAAAV
jgi:hypothetical protein